ncbi:CDP-alcohol phosphatidyltransferase family protein [Desulfobacterota bacterium AH_259_B03_O07]|nr:CDP-alcohol phosphatidyltransferase family protein [Desulfobacterota bacterium AH_259_B03_O07]
MDHAILVAAGTGLDGEDLSSFGNIVFGSVPQVKRLIITAQRAGIKRFSIITDTLDSPLKDLLINDKRIDSEIEWHKLGKPVKFESSPSLVLQSNLVTTPVALSEFMKCSVKNDEILLLVDRSQDAGLKADNGSIEDIYLGGGRAVGAFIASGRLLEKSIMNSMSLDTWAQELVGGGKLKFTEFSNGYWMRITSDPTSPKKAERLIISHVGKTLTGWISRNINSKISLRVSRYLIRTPLTPNMISVLTNMIGVLSGPFYAIGHPVWGAICLQIATVLDRCDGEVARIKLMETKRGQWVDTISDQLTILSFVVGVTIGYYGVAGNPIVLVFGGLNLGIFIFFLIWSFYFLVRYTNSGSLVSYFNVDKLIIKEQRTLVHKLILYVRPMSRRNFYSLGLLVLAIIGGSPWVFWCITISLILFLIHQIEDIIMLKKLKPETTLK